MPALYLVTTPDGTVSTYESSTRALLDEWLELTVGDCTVRALPRPQTVLRDAIQLARAAAAEN